MIWQPPFPKDKTEAKVWIWKVGLGAGGATGKPPLVLLDLSFPYEDVRGVEFSTSDPSYFLEPSNL